MWTDVNNSESDMNNSELIIENRVKKFNFVSCFSIYKAIHYLDLILQYNCYIGRSMGLFFFLLLSFFSNEKIKLFEIMWFSQGHTINEWKKPDSSYNSPSLNSVDALSTSSFYKLEYLRRIKKNIQDFFISINSCRFALLTLRGKKI